MKTYRQEQLADALRCDALEHCALNKPNHRTLHKTHIVIAVFKSTGDVFPLLLLLSCQSEQSQQQQNHIQRELKC